MREALDELGPFEEGVGRVLVELGHLPGGDLELGTRAAGNGGVTLAVAGTYLEELREADVDTLILGCTHYPILKKAIELFTVWRKFTTQIENPFKSGLHIGDELSCSRLASTL